MGVQKMKRNNAEMRALQELRKVIDEMLNEDFDSNRKPALMALKVKKVEALPMDEMKPEDMASEVPGELSEALGKEVSPDMEMPSDESTEIEVKSPNVELEVESEEDESEEEEDSDAVKKLRELLGK